MTRRVALVTGGARGIGFAIGQRLAEDGYAIVISDILSEAAADSAMLIATASNVETLALSADVSKPDHVNKMIEDVVSKFGTLDILVNNAGIARDNLMLRLEERDWDLVMAVNLKSAFLCTKAASRVMMKNRWGRIINMSSVVGVMGNAGQANYSASKAGLIGLTKSAAKELGSRNITVNAIAPGYIQTEMTENLPQAAKDGFLSQIPLKRPGTPQDVARVVSFLASDDAEYITGQVIHCDGGMVM
jgi:3-oxoacyl-[acyl-carrier protein] reductase